MPPTPTANAPRLADGGAPPRSIPGRAEPPRDSSRPGPSRHAPVPESFAFPPPAALPAPARSPEERELKQKQSELSSLESELDRQELRLANLRSEVLPFEARYIRKVGIRSARLDEIEARIAEFHSQCHPEDAELREAASRARERAQRSRAAVLRHVSPRAPEPQPELRGLYRSVARRIHPDFSADPTDRQVRQHLMAHANHAYQRGDERRLRGILTEYQFRPEGVPGDDTAAELVRVIRRIAVIHGRLEQIRQETEETRSSDLYHFMTRVKAAAKQGRDLLAEAATAFSTRIADARRQFRRLTAQPTAR